MLRKLGHRRELWQSIGTLCTSRYVYCENGGRFGQVTWDLNRFHAAEQSQVQFVRCRTNTCVRP